MINDFDGTGRNFLMNSTLSLEKIIFTAGKSIITLGKQYRVAQVLCLIFALFVPLLFYVKQQN